MLRSAPADPLSGVGDFVRVAIQIRGAEVQMRVQTCQVQQPPDDRLPASDDEFMPAPGQALVWMWPGHCNL
jgi:hypothetical protein